jgi:hypothetical protein
VALSELRAESLGRGGMEFTSMLLSSYSESEGAMVHHPREKRQCVAKIHRYTVCQWDIGENNLFQF